MRSEEEIAKIPGRDLVNKDHPQVIEIWNNVFIQYNRKKDGSLEGWVRKIVVNTALNNIKKNKHVYDELEIESARAVESDIESVLDNYDSKLIWDIMQQLPEGYRIILNMYAIEGYSHKEIAEHLNIAEGTSRSQLLRAKVLMQKLLEKNDIFIKY